MVMDVKQVIVMRKDLGMTKGKMIAQGAHASMAFICEFGKNIFDSSAGRTLMRLLSADEAAWVESSFTKICVYVKSEEELLQIHADAQEAGLTSYLITDKGLTMFKGVPTHTCIAIGPAKAEDLDKVTGHLPLL